MIDIESLRKFGFGDFEFLRKEQRDELHRMTLIRQLEDRFFTVRVVYVNEEWQIDFLNLDNDQNGEILYQYLPEEYTLEDVLFLLEKLE